MFCRVLIQITCFKIRKRLHVAATCAAFSCDYANQCLCLIKKLDNFVKKVAETLQKWHLFLFMLNARQIRAALRQQTVQKPTSIDDSKAFKMHLAITHFILSGIYS